MLLITYLTCMLVSGIWRQAGRKAASVLQPQNWSFTIPATCQTMQLSQLPRSWANRWSARTDVTYGFSP